MNIANALTVLRILLIPAFAYAYFKAASILALGVFLLAALTDYLDGYLARKLNIVTKVGKLLDPLADKLMLLTALYCLASTSRVPWWVFVSLAVKEGLMVIGSSFILLEKKVAVYSNILGKASTVAFVLAIALVFPYTAAPPPLIGKILLYAAMASSFVAMGVYAKRATTIGRTENEEEKAK